MATAFNVGQIRFTLAASVVFVVATAHAQHDELISDCLSTYINRGCHSWCIGQPVERDADVCYIGENRWLSDIDLGGFAHGRNVPQGRYFYVHNLVNAIVRSRGRNHRSVDLTCIMDFRGHQRDRDYFSRSDDRAFYDYYKDNHGVDLKGIDHCFVRIGDDVRTITLEQLLRQMKDGLNRGSPRPSQDANTGPCTARAVASNGAYGDGLGVNLAAARYWALHFCSQRARDCRIVRESCP